jgi:hypothetical protein
MPTNADITDVSLGSAGVASLYLGSNMIWPKKPLALALAWEAQLLALYGNGTPAWINNTVSQRQAIPASCRNNTTAISISQFQACALLSDGTPVVWGVNQLGVLDVPATAIQNSKFAAITGNTGFAVTKTGSVVSWGQSIYGIRSIPAGLTDVEDLALGGSFVIARKSNGTLVGWGTNTDGLLNIPAGLNRVVNLFFGFSCVVAVREEGDYVVWGTGSWPSTFSSIDTVFATTSMGGGGTHYVLKLNGNLELHRFGSMRVVHTEVAAIPGGGEFALKFDGTVVTIPRQ